MRKISCCMLTLLLLCTLSACGKQQTLETDYTPSEIAEAIIKSQTEIPTLTPLTPADEYFVSYLSNYYLMDSEQLEDGIIYYADGVEASEIAVLLLNVEDDTQAVATELLTYITNRAGDFEGYAPQQAALVKNGTVSIHGRYVALLICPDAARAEDAFLACFGETEADQSAVAPALPSAAPAEEPAKPAEGNAADPSSSPENTGGPVDVQEPSNSTPLAEASGNPSETEKTSPSPSPTEGGSQPAETQTTVLPTPSVEVSSEPVVAEGTYSAASVLSAWQTGDKSSLTDMNRSIYEAAKNVIAEEIDDHMSDYEKELAIHDWMTGWSSFDMNAFSHAPADRAEADNRNPYGFLINKSAMCHGYSSTFQLFMDMLDIECITVFGTPSSSGVEHSWNMVRLDGDWYCVDTAWDDPIGGTPTHTYFNVTSQRLRDGSIHRWDDTTVPEATATTYAYGRS